jgi:hypothetical protein
VTQVAREAEMRAVCDGAEAALAFVLDEYYPVPAPRILGTIADRLTARGEFDLARAFIVVLNPADPHDLLNAARRHLQRHDNDAARTAALQALPIVLEQCRDAEKYAIKWRTFVNGSVSVNDLLVILVDAGEYDEAVAAAQRCDEEPGRDGPPYAKGELQAIIVERAIRNGDAAAVARLAPLAIGALTQPGPDLATGRPRYHGDDLYRLTRELMDAGFREAARVAYQHLTGAMAHDEQHADLQKLAVLQALFGDVPAALATADRAGPLVVRTRADEIFPGHKAGTLQAISVALAGQGNIDGALRAEAELEAGLGDVLPGVSGYALSSIAAAQTRAGDLRGALTTAMRITGAGGQFKALLPLVSAPPHQ